MTTTTHTSIASSFTSILRSKDMAMAIVLVIIVALMLVPLPTVMLDLLIALNMAISIGVMLMSMYIASPMEFSAFPTVLLMITLFRLGLNIATSRQILLSADGGSVITTFGNLIVGGNYVVGVVIFLILMIIQFTVINSGAARVAEVAARFTLDAMPGKQMSIDADMNAGIIDENQARERRKAIETEADFYGAMDGAIKFVKGDAAAAVIIMAVNILGGFVIGVLQKNFTLVEALQRYALLTVGAGLAVQIPALLVSSASGLILTRSTSEKSLGVDLFAQLANVNSLFIAALMVAAMAMIPGLPKLPFLLVAAALGTAAYFVQRMKNKPVPEVEPANVKSAEPESPEDMLTMVVVDPLELEIGYALIPLIDNESGDNLLKRISTIRRQMMTELGLVLPIVRIRDNLRLQPQAYRVKLRGQEVAQGELYSDMLLAIPGSESDASLTGIQTTEPAFGLPALWISEAESGRAELMGYTVVNPLSVISTHLTEIARSFAPELLGRQMVQEMLTQLKQKSPASVEGVIPDLLGLGELQAVLRHLLRERIPIRDLSGILEVVANNAHTTRDPHILAEAVRQSMASTISALYRDDSKTLHVVTISPQLEATLRSALVQSDGGFSFQIDSISAQKILSRTGDAIEGLAKAGYYPILLCPREIRLAFRHLVEQALPSLVVLAFSEVSQGTKVRSHGMVDLNQE
jgi:flagellar biosynthesis protein FlhA